MYRSYDHTMTCKVQFHADCADVVDRWMNPSLAHGIYLANIMVPHGPVLGYHVAPLYWLAYEKIVLNPHELNP
jgi:hypothetical protein